MDSLSPTDETAPPVEVTELPDAPTPDPLASTEPPAASEPIEGSDAAASLEFGRNMVRLREARGLTQNRLAAEADIGLDSVRDYELGKYRPKQPKLWQLAQTLDVMPISLGPGATRGGAAPVPTETQLRQKGSRALRVQHLVELLAGGHVSNFGQLAGLDAGSVYALASLDAQLSDAQLEPLLAALPQVRRAWLLSAEGEPLQAVLERPLPAPVREEPLPEGPPLESGAGGARAVEDPPPPPVPMGRPTPLPFLPAPARFAVGAPLYVPLGGGQVAEIVAVVAGGRGAVSQVRLLAGAGELPVLTSEDQLDLLCAAIRGVLTQTVDPAA